MSKTKTEDEKLPEADRFTKQLLRISDINDRDTLVESQVSNIPKEYWEHLPPVQTFTDINKLFYSDYHALVEGRTGSGKTTLELTLMKKFIEQNRIVLFRDDGGLEFPYLSAYYPTRIFIPDEKDVQLHLYGFKADIVRFKDPKEIIHSVYDYRYPLNVIVYDVYTNTVRQRARFYSRLFMTLINTLQRMRKRDKEKIVFGIDELNDLIPPRGKGSPETAFTRADIEMNIRKIRKHKVQIVASSHRFNQIGVDTRSQMEHIYFKKSYGYDAWDFLSKNLVSSNSKTFWAMLRRLITLPRNLFVLFDANRNFDCYKFGDIPRNPNIDIEPLGYVPEDSKDKESVFRERYLAWMQLMKENEVYLLQHGKMQRVTVKFIAEHDGVTTQNLYRLSKKYKPTNPENQAKLEKLI